MQVTITTRHGQLGEESKQWIHRKVERLVRYFSRIMAIEVTVDLQSAERVAVELLLSAEHKRDFVAKAEAGSVYAALDHALARMEQQLRKYKSRIQEHRPGEPPPAPKLQQPDEESPG